MILKAMKIIIKYLLLVLLSASILIGVFVFDDFINHDYNHNQGNSHCTCEECKTFKGYFNNHIISIIK